MRRLLIGLAAGVLGVVCLAGTADAHGFRGRGHVHYRSGCYSRARHPRWGQCVWNARFCRWQYLDAGCGTWYYWAPQAQCYYPVTPCP
jgi:hypothetical protein